MSPFRIVRIVDREGAIQSIRQNAETVLECSRQGYYRHPEDCSRLEIFNNHNIKNILNQNISDFTAVSNSISTRMTTQYSSMVVQRVWFSMTGQTRRLKIKNIFYSKMSENIYY